MSGEGQDNAARAQLPLDPELAKILASEPLLSVSVHERHIARFREAGGAFRPNDEVLARDGAISIEETHTVSALDGVDIPLLILRPTRITATACMCFLHGGGLFSGDNRTGIESVLDWIDQLGLVVVSVGYRLAPENRYPIPVEDCYAGLLWAEANRDELGVGTFPLMVGGASAGGGLAAALALLARSRGGPRISDQMLMCPMLDDREAFPSSIELENGVWDRHSNHTGWTALLGEAKGTVGVSSFAAASREENLTGLPVAYLDVGAVETFRDETIDYATRLAQAGVPTELHVWAGAFHGFDVIAANSAVARAARSVRLDYLKRRLGGGTV